MILSSSVKYKPGKRLQTEQAGMASQPCELFSLDRVYKPLLHMQPTELHILVKTNSLKYIPHVGSHYFKNINLPFADSLTF